MLRSPTSSVRDGIARSLARYHPEEPRVLPIIRELGNDRSQNDRSAFVAALINLAEVSKAVKCEELAAIAVENAGHASGYAEEAFAPYRCGAAVGFCGGMRGTALRVRRYHVTSDEVELLRRGLETVVGHAEW